MLNHRDKVSNPRLGRFIELYGLHILDYIPDTFILLATLSENIVHRFIPDSPARLVDNPQKSLLILRVHQKRQIGQDILHLFSLIEGEAAYQLIGHTFAPERLLKDPALIVGAIEERNIRLQEAEIETA